MGCGISKFQPFGANNHHHDLTTCSEYSNIHDGKERGMINDSEDDYMKEKERSGLVEKVKQSKKEEQKLSPGKDGRRYCHARDFGEDQYDPSRPSECGTEDSFHYPRSPSFRDYCMDPNRFFGSGDHADHIASAAPESRITNKVQETSEGDELVKKEGRGRIPGIRGVLSRGRHSRIRSYLHVPSWHHHNNPLSPSQRSPQKLVAAGN